MLTLEQLEKLKEGFAPGTVGELVAGFNAPLFLAALDLAKLALTPPQDVAGLVDELQEAAGVATQTRAKRYRKAADALLSLSARNRALEAGLKPFADEAKEWESCTHPDSFVPLSVQYTLGDLRRAANLQGNGDE